MTFEAIYTFGYDRDDHRSFQFEAPNIDAAMKTAKASNPYESQGYWRIHRVEPIENQ